MSIEDSSQGESFGLHQKIGLWGGAVAALLIYFFADIDPSRPVLAPTAAVAVLMAVWWITDAIPLAVTSLLPLVLFPLLGIMGGKEVATKYFDDVICLYLGGFLVAIAMERWNLHRRIALRVLLWFGFKPRMILLGFMTATGFISMWISNTATAMMMVPIGIAILLKLEELTGGDEIRRYGTALLLGIAYASSIGGLATPVGTPTNLVFFRIYDAMVDKTAQISFMKWVLFATPLSMAMLLAAWGILTVFFRLTGNLGTVDQTLFQKEHAALGPMTWAQKVVAWDFAILALLWMTREGIAEIGLPGWSSLFENKKLLTDGTAAMALSIPLFLIPSRAKGSRRILEESSIEKIPWGVVLLFGGGFALASAFESSGLSLWVGEKMGGLRGLHPMVLILGVATLVTFLTELTSNTATAQVVLPIFAANAAAMGMNPIVLMIPAVLSSSLGFMMPVGTPPNAIVFGTKRVPMQSMVRVGFFINLAGILLTTLLMWLWAPVVFGVNVSAGK
ncbi:SLC13/DASS family transporter [Candidatus Sumerlaeota bacterium]|nr:SLC13/DASS family transporter [Candidatus Sumerlaeota bacterium]